MKKTFFFLSIILWVQSYSQKNIYENSRFDELSQDHEVLAIVPFLAKLELEQKLSKEEKIKLAEREGYAVQDAFETYFSRRKKRKKFNVEFQNIKNTNAILAQNNITYENIDIYTVKQLSDILGVDGVISGNLDLNILLSKGVPTEFNFLDYFSGDANYGRIGVKISDGSTGKLLWKYEKEITKKTGKNTTELIDRMMKLASRKFPYDKEKKRKKRKN
ncbi:hypothetical protein MTsPCn9_01590 [Croceitalea sp. MTPC9]|uniref:hypothetical protein n=1 Tax=unclassified Croceitalea TaxID=2632280 RepID=UPI002B397FFB|nr:hypothetical protein MTsPCn6_07120 [Croceitalea sp. MTPC6]GMN15223.1 hypothetical protein MTsPCn9_01590 [Croceitalea sp. MTPC9]